MIIRALPINLLEITPKNIPYPEVFLQIEIYFNKERVMLSLKNMIWN